MSDNHKETSSPLRLMFVNRCYGPGEATGQLLAELCQDLARYHKVTVIAGQPNVQGAEPLPAREMVQGVEVIRVQARRFRKTSLWSRAFGLGSFLWRAAMAAVREPRPDVMIIESDPPMLGMLGAVLRRWHGCRMINYLQDLFPEVGLALGRLKPGMITKVLYVMTQVGLQTADRVVVLGDDMMRRVRERGVEPERITIIPNWSDTTAIQPTAPSEALRRAWGLTGRFVVMYSGNLGLSQSLNQVIAAAELLRDEPVAFLFVGDGALKNMLRAEAERRGLTNVQFEPYQPKQQLAESLSVADVHLITLQRGLAGYIVPSKLYGILAAGRAYVAAVERESEVARVTDEAGCGVRVEPDNPDELAAAIRWCVAHPERLVEMGLRGRRLAVERYDRAAAVSRFTHLVESLATAEVPVSAAVPATSTSQ